MFTFLKNLFINKNRYVNHPEGVIISCFYNPKKSPHISKTYLKQYLKTNDRRITSKIQTMKYVSAPYSSALDKDQRMVIVTTYSATCLLRDEHVICPLTMGHNFIKTSVKLPFQSEWWLDWCINLLAGCDEMDVLMLPGWDTSIGVTAEIEYAQENGIKINYIKSEDLWKPQLSQPQSY